MSADSAGRVVSEPIPGSTQRGVVLVVDDDADQQDLLRVFLEGAGYAVCLAGNAEEALALIAANPMDVVVLDVVMPGIDGFAACRRVRANPLTLDLPVVLVTALNSREERVLGIQAGADDFLSKPVNREELLARVNSLVRLNRARKALEKERLEAEAAKVERMRATFERYVAPSLVERILHNPDASSALMEARRVEDVVAMFADLRGFTRMCSTLNVEASVNILNSFFTALVDITRSYEGTTFGMAGDSLLVGFNVPVAQPDAPSRAVSSAVDMMTRFRPLARQWQDDYGVDVGVGFGINRGSAIVGNVGAPSHMAYTLIGDAVNVAARLSQLAGAGEILMSVAAVGAMSALTQTLGVEKMPLTSLKGKDTPVPYFRIMDNPGLESALAKWKASHVMQVSS